MGSVIFHLHYSFPPTCLRQFLYLTADSYKSYLDIGNGYAQRSSINKSRHIALIVGSVIGSLVPIIFCISLIICCVAPCCLCYKKCRKRRNQRQIAVITTVNTLHPVSPTGYQPSYPSGYHFVPTYEGPSIPTAPPPSYLESTNPAYSTGVFSHGQPMYMHQPSSEPHAELPHLDELIQPPYNPSYGPNP